MKSFPKSDEIESGHWTNEVLKSEMSIFWCISMPNNAM